MTTEKHYTLSDFDYDLPEELIAQTPLKQRDASRLLVLNAETGQYLSLIHISEPTRH